MMSVSEGARREALNHVEALGLDNLVARNRGSGPTLTAGDAQQLAELVPLTRTASPLVERYLRLSRADKSEMARVLGVRASYGTILRLGLERGRFLSSIDEQSAAQVCVLGSAVARRLFGYRDPIGERVRVGIEYYLVVGVLREQGIDPRAPNTLAWRDLNAVAMVPLPALSGRTIEVAPMQTADEIWLQVEDGQRVDDLAKVFEHSLVRMHGGRRDFDLVVPRELLAQR